MSTGTLTAYEQFIQKLGLEDREGQRIATWNLVELVRGPAGESLALQAPTGTGKSISALLAGVDATRGGEGRVAIGTATVMLSEQYWDDIRMVEAVFPEVNFFVLKGASHYICNNKVDAWVRKMQRLSVGNLKVAAALREGLAELKAWIEGTSVASTPPSWAAANSEDCKDCRNSSALAGGCDYAVARAAARVADVVITSHAMLMIDLEMKKRFGKDTGADADSDTAKTPADILGKISTYVFDEAHKLSGQVSEMSISHWDIGFMDRMGLLRGALGINKARALVEHFSKFAEVESPYAMMNRWISAESCVSGAKDLVAIWPTKEEIKLMSKMGLEKIDLDTDRDRLFKVCSFLSRSSEVLADLADGDADGFTAFWCNGRGYSLKEMAIRPWFAETLRDYRVCYLSATLGVNREGQERYTLDTLGVPITYDFSVESPFDYAEQMEVARVDWKRVDGRGDGLIECCAWLASRLAGGMVVLTGGHAQKEWIDRELTGRGLISRAQAAGGRGAAKRDRASIQAHKDLAAEDGDIGTQVLVGVDTFSTGMNLPGEELTKLFIHGIKPIREDGPYVAWRKRWIEAEGGDGFLDYELPEKAIVLEQQIGRLIRTQKDWGVVLLGYRFGNAEERAIVDLALSAFDGYNEVELSSLGKRWWKR